MSISLSEAPWLSLPSEEMWSSQGPTLLARQAEKHGPVLRWRIPYGQGAEEEKAILVGPEANRFVLHTHRDYFSHERGWTPAIGHLMGKGLLNMDPPEHCGLLATFMPNGVPMRVLPRSRATHEQRSIAPARRTRQ